MTKHLWRAYAADVQLDGRTLSSRFVPYNETAHVADEVDGKIDRYIEGFRPRSFATQAATRERGVLQRIAMRHLHDGGLGFIGQVASLRETPSGLEGDVTILTSRIADVRDLYESGVSGVSIEYVALRNGTSVEDGVRWRTRAALLGVALEPDPAYTTARVLCFRSDGTRYELEDPEPEEPETPPESPESDETVVETPEEAPEAVLASWLEEEQQKQRALNARFGIEGALVDI